MVEITPISLRLNGQKVTTPSTQGTYHGTANNDTLNVTVENGGQLGISTFHGFLITPTRPVSIDTEEGNDYVQLTRNNGTSGNGAVSFNGGEGYDTLLLYGNMADWTLTSQQSSFYSAPVMTNIKTGQSVLVTNFETLKFEDGNIIQDPFKTKSIPAPTGGWFSRTRTTNNASEKLSSTPLGVNRLQSFFDSANATPTPKQFQAALPKLQAALTQQAADVAANKDQFLKATNNEADMKALESKHSAEKNAAKNAAWDQYRAGQIDKNQYWAATDKIDALYDKDKKNIEATPAYVAEKKGRDAAAGKFETAIAKAVRDSGAAQVIAPPVQKPAPIESPFQTWLKNQFLT